MKRPGVLQSRDSYSRGKSNTQHANVVPGYQVRDAVPSGGEPRAGLMVHWEEVADETATLVHLIVHFVGLPGPRGSQAAAWLQRHGIHEGCSVCKKKRCQEELLQETHKPAPGAK